MSNSESCKGRLLAYRVTMKLKIFSWNVRGLNNRAKRRVLKTLIVEWRVDGYCLQETN